MRATIVAGPPGSGKTTYVRDRLRWGDVQVDYDALWMAVSGQGVHDKPAGLFDIVTDVRMALLDSIARRQPAGHVWIVGGFAKRAEREAMTYRFNADVVILETAPHECLRRIQLAGGRDRQLSAWEPLIKKWWDAYERSEESKVIRG